MISKTLGDIFLLFFKLNVIPVQGLTFFKRDNHPALFYLTLDTKDIGKFTFALTFK